MEHKVLCRLPGLEPGGSIQCIPHASHQHAPRPAGDACYLSALNLTKGYWQVPLRVEDHPKTAFTKPQGLFHFQKMPFSLHGAAATFQRLVDMVLAHCHDYAMAYIDNIIVFSPTWEAHLQHLRTVLEALREADLKANPTKSHLGFQELKYLRFLVGHGMVHPLPEKVLRVQHYPQPKTK